MSYTQTIANLFFSEYEVNDNDGDYVSYTPVKLAVPLGPHPVGTNFDDGTIHFQEDNVSVELITYRPDGPDTINESHDFHLLAIPTSAEAKGKSYSILEALNIAKFKGLDCVDVEEGVKVALDLFFELSGEPQSSANRLIYRGIIRQALGAEVEEKKEESPSSSLAGDVLEASLRLKDDVSKLVDAVKKKEEEKVNPIKCRVCGFLNDEEWGEDDDMLNNCEACEAVKTGECIQCNRKGEIEVGIGMCRTCWEMECPEDAFRCVDCKDISEAGEGRVIKSLGGKYLCDFCIFEKRGNLVCCKCAEEDAEGFKVPTESCYDTWMCRKCKAEADEEEKKKKKAPPFKIKPKADSTIVRVSDVPHPPHEKKKGYRMKIKGGGCQYYCNCCLDARGVGWSELDAEGKCKSCVDADCVVCDHEGEPKRVKKEKRKAPEATRGGKKKRV